jgi:hypothetical protein
MEGTRCEAVGRKPFKEQTATPGLTHMHTKCAPAFDPVAKIVVSDGDKKPSGLLAVELFAVAPEIFKRRESNAIK